MKREGVRLLKEACENGDLIAIKQIFFQEEEKEKGNKVDINFKFSDGESLIQFVCRKNCANVTKLLITHKNIELNEQNKEGNTPLHTACFYNCSQIVSYLCENPKVDVNKQNNEGKTPIQISYSYRFGVIVMHLLKHPQIKVSILEEVRKESIFVFACRQRDPKVLRLFIPQIHLIDSGIANNAVFAICQFIEDTEMLKILLNHFSDKIDVNKALKEACVHGNKIVVEYFLNNNVKIDLNKNIENRTHLQHALFNRKDQIVQLLLKQPDIDVNVTSEETGDTALHYECHKYGSSFTKLLLSEYPNIELRCDIKNKQGKTAFYLACELNRYYIVDDLFLKCKIDINDKNHLSNNGHSPLYVACLRGYFEIVKLLCEKSQIK